VSDTFTRYGSNITNVWQEILTPVTLAFCCEVVHENYKNPSVFVKVTAKKISGTFLCGHMFTGMPFQYKKIFTGTERRSHAFPHNYTLDGKY